MLGLVARDWWVFAIRGIAAIVLGILAFIWPERTLTVLVFLFGAYFTRRRRRAARSRSLAATQRRGGTPGPWGSWASSASSSASPPSCRQA